jgi:opacity protein-like surface antigen
MSAGSSGSEATLGSARKWVLSLAALAALLAPSMCAAQAPALQSQDVQSPYNATTAAPEENGFTLNAFYGGSFFSGRHVTELNGTVGYNFNQYFGVDVGVPFYFIDGSRTFETPLGARERNFGVNGIGNVYADLLFNFVNPTVTYLGTLRGTAPTGNTKTGFSTGRVTYDWDNYFDHDFGRLRPFVDVGLANSISDTQFFFRPFVTLGTVVPSEAGVSFRIVRHTRLGASLYDDAPIGPQKVFSRINGSEIVGPARIDRDNGYSGWLTVSPISFLVLEAGYDHSVHYALNVFSFGIAIDVKDAYRRVRRPL